MNFPHLDSMQGAPLASPDLRVLISKAMSRQGNSPTARAMLAKSREQSGTAPRDTPCGLTAMQERIHYFAAELHQANAASAPYGAFFPSLQAEFSPNLKHDQSVYQDGLGNRKVDSISMDLSETLKTSPGQKKTRIL